LRLSDFDYQLPPELIAQFPLPQRDASRLLVLHRHSSSLEHRSFPELIDLCSPGDLLVLNDARVLPCRLRGIRGEAGGRVEVLLLREREGGIWEALLKPGRRVRKGQHLTLARGRITALVLDEGRSERRLLRFEENGKLPEILRQWGEMPLPPYIKRPSEGKQAAELKRLDADRYQTVFARQEGAVAAPTAGLHFTWTLLDALRGRGVELTFLTLKVGPGTFQPVRTERIEDHLLEAEEYFISEETAQAISRCRGRGGRVIAVGTTCVRALESAAHQDGTVRAGLGTTSLFIYPGYRFRVVDCLLTNFHLPRSTLLMLVYAFAGPELARRAYQEAVAQRYRFFSYGDAMFID
jgi:S-adenosylmethionine:tRNA ribosyltransferase-isomerase